MEYERGAGDESDLDEGAEASLQTPPLHCRCMDGRMPRGEEGEGERARHKGRNGEGPHRQGGSSHSLVQGALVDQGGRGEQAIKKEIVEITNMNSLPI